MSTTSRLVVVALALGAGLACGAEPEPRAASSGAQVVTVAQPSERVPERALEVTLLANEGFLLRSADRHVLIDAFVSKPYAGFDALSGEPLERLRKAEPPFDAVTVALVSHQHADHVQAEPARAFLSASPDTLFVSSPQVLDVVRGGDAFEIPNRESQLPSPGSHTRRLHHGVGVDFLHLPHGDDGPDPIQNFGHVITLGEHRVLHLGDAQALPANFRPHTMLQREFDVALVPWWYFFESGGRELLRDVIRARVVIACHVASADRDELAAEISERYPDVIVPEASMQTWVLTARAR